MADEYEPITVVLRDGESAANGGMNITNQEGHLTVTFQNWDGQPQTDNLSSELYVGGPGAVNGATTIYQAVD